MAKSQIEIEEDRKAGVNQSLPMSGVKYEEEKKEEEKPTEPLDLATLHAMPKDALISIVQRMYCQCGLVAVMSEDETAQAMLDTLAHTALKPIAAGLNMRADIQSRMAAIDKWLDRTRGKSVQTIVQANINANAKAFDMTNEQLESAVLRLSSAGQLPSGVKVLPGGMLEIGADYHDVTED